ncbi:MAG TPA: ABC transporter permease [Anaerolineales bacterium]
MLRRIWALTQKESIQLLRMPIVYIGLTIGPILELMLFVVAVHTDVQHIPMVVADQSLSAASQQYLNAFTQSAYFDIVAAVPDQKGIIDAINRGQASIGILIPADFADQLQAHNASVLVLVDGSNSFVTQAASADAAAISQEYAISLIRTPGSVAPASALAADFLILYNPDLKELWFLVPAFGAFLLYGIALKMTAFAVVREREAGTIEALLVTPMRPIELMIGKMLPNLVLAFLDMIFTFALGIWIFGVPFRGSLLLFLALAALFAMGSLGLGLAISSVSQSQVQAQQLATLMNVAVMFVSGFMFPAYGLPWLLRLLGYTMPMTFFMSIANGIITKGVGLDALWAPSLGLIALTGVIFYVGARLFRQDLE